MMLRTLRTQVKWILVFFLLCFVLAIPLMYGVRGSRSRKEENGDYPVAEIDGRTVMFSQLLNTVRNYVDQTGIKDITSVDVPAIHQMALDQMVLREALAKEVRNLGLKPSKEDLNRAIKNIEDQFPTKEAFRQYLDESGISVKKLEEQLERQLAESLLLEEASASAWAGDEELQAFYDSIKEFAFTSPAGVEVLMAEFTNKEAADEARARLAGGASWDVVMADFTSEDLKDSTSSANSTVIRQESAPEKLAFVASMDNGAYSESVEFASDDYMVIYRKGLKEKETVPFGDVKEQLRNMVIAQKKQDLQKAFLNGLSAKMTVKILDPSIFPVKAAESPSSQAISPDEAAETVPDTASDADSKEPDTAGAP